MRIQSHSKLRVWSQWKATRALLYHNAGLQFVNVSTPESLHPLYQKTFTASDEARSQAVAMIADSVILLL